MANLNLRPGWHIPERRVTSEAVFFNRRHFMKALGLSGAGLLAPAALSGASESGPQKTVSPAGQPPKQFPARRNPSFNPGWHLTNEKVAGSYNNFY